MSMRELRYYQAINEALAQSLEADPSVYLLGLGVPGPTGIFGTTSGLAERFGPDRVLDMPSAEGGMTGVALGTTITGMRPIMVHMRVDFAILAMDQMVNQVAKWHFMYGGKLRDDPNALGNLTEHMAGGADSIGEMMYQMMALMGWTSLHWLHQIKQPTLVIAGKDDPIVSPTNAHTMANRIPRARLELVDCGHLCVLTLADEIAAMVDDFLGGPA